MPQRHPQLPWVLFQAVPGGWRCACERCGVMTAVPAHASQSFLTAHAHQPARGLGDLFSRAAKWLGFEECGGCAARKEWLNQRVPF